MPYTMNDLDDVRVYYEFAGVDGPPLVLLHDSGSTSAIWHHLGYVAGLADAHRLIMIDLRGHGRSDKPADETAYSMPLLVSDVVAVLNRAGVERAHVLGYGLGGQVAFGLGLLAPERCDSLIIGGCSPEPVAIDAALARMTAPALLFAGDEDDDCLHDARIAAERLPNAVLVVIPGENHASTIARAGKTSPHILTFLARVSDDQRHAA